MKKLIVVLLAAASAIPASAAVVTYTDRAAFLAAADTQTYDFETGLNNDGYLNYSLSHDFGPFTLTTNDTLYDIAGFISGSFWMGSENAYTPGSIMTITFDTPVTAFGADLGAFFASQAMTISTALGNFPLTTSSNTQQSTFFGITTDVAITSLTFSGNTVKLDNVSYGTLADVPEPAMLGLFGLGAIGLGLGRRRKV